MWDMFQKLFSGITDFFGSAIHTVIDWVLSLVNYIIGGVADLIFNFLSACGLTIEIPANVFDILRELSIGIGYIIPVQALLPIPTILISFYLIKLVFSIYQLIAGTIIKVHHVTL